MEVKFTPAQDGPPPPPPPKGILKLPVAKPPPKLKDFGFGPFDTPPSTPSPTHGSSTRFPWWKLSMFLVLLMAVLALGAAVPDLLSRAQYSVRTAYLPLLGATGLLAPGGIYGLVGGLLLLLMSYDLWWAAKQAMARLALTPWLPV
jgi:hypothetical protein